MGIENIVSEISNLCINSQNNNIGKIFDETISKFENEESRSLLVLETNLENFFSTLKYYLDPTYEYQDKVANVIAEIAKEETIRKKCVEVGLVSPLLLLLKSSHIDTLIQTCRALGNICYDYDIGRNIINAENGCDFLMNVLRSYLEDKSENVSKLHQVACGFLLNLTNTHEEIQEKVISLNAIDVLKQYLLKHNDDEAVCQMVLLCIECLAESDTGRKSICETDIPIIVSNLLCSDDMENLHESILELLANLAESDDVKTKLAKSDLSKQLIKMVQIYENPVDDHDDDATLIKVISDFIVLLLTGDDSMLILYNNGEGELFKECVTWLKSSSKQMKIAGALAIGNFARNDALCIALVQKDITTNLLELIKENKPEEAPVIVHAALSALRNLAIPIVNKKTMMNCQILEVVTDLIHFEMMTVQFKLLGLLRMLIDSQESAAEYLGTRRNFVEKLSELCAVEDHAGVKGEANRLIAWIIKNCPKEEVIKNFIESGAALHQIIMMKSEHTLMQNEAILSLIFISNCYLEKSVEILKDAELIPTIKNILDEENTVDEVVCNILVLVRRICTSSILLEQMKKEDFQSLISKYEKSTNANLIQLSSETLSLFSNC